MKYDSDKIKGIIKLLKQQYNFQGLLHHTNIFNLEKIFKSGYLLSREDCDNKNINFFNGANLDIIDKTSDEVKKSVRFYYRPKTPTLYNVEGIKDEVSSSYHIPIPIYLVFDEKLMLEDFTFFSDGNAASKYTHIGNDFNFLNSVNWNYVFHSEPIKNFKMKNEIIRQRQAEVLSSKKINLKRYLKMGILRSKAEKKLFEKYELNKYVPKVIVNKDFFICENVFIKDYSLYYKKEQKKLVIVLELNNISSFKLNHPRNTIKSYYKNKKIREEKLNKVACLKGNKLLVEYFIGEMNCFDLVIYLYNNLCFREYIKIDA